MANNNTKIFQLGRLTATLGLSLIVMPALAQQVPTVPVPNAGQLLQQDKTVQLPPKVSPSLQIAPITGATAAAGGGTVVLQKVEFSGNTLFSGEQLNAVLGNVEGQAYDLAGLQALTQEISAYHRAAGYPFVRVLIPEQQLANGVLNIVVIEGRYGKVIATGESGFTEAAQDFLTPLTPGSVIESAQLERSTLILDDLPGIKTSSLLRPGQEVGTGDLVVDIVPTPALKGEVGLDNHNNRYTGEYRARASLQWDSPFMVGDQITGASSVTNESQWLGNLGYSLPLGSSGLRGYAGYAHTQYQLAKEFTNLDAIGSAQIASVGLSYPLIRSAQTNLAVAGNYQYKKLDDKQGATGFHSTKNSHVAPLTLQFDRRDNLGGGGITYGSVGYTLGDLDLDASAKLVDAMSANTQGSFNKLNLDAARIQATPLDNVTLFGRVSAQWADKNLDSSEDFGLGGPYGVRAYPVGEGFGDQGWFTQLETRYQLGSFVPYAFYDAGRVRINKNPWTVGDNSRALGGYGVGARYNDQTITIDANLAWRAQGGQPTSDTRDRNPQLWVTTGFKF